MKSYALSLRLCAALSLFCAGCSPSSSQSVPVSDDAVAPPVTEELSEAMRITGSERQTKRSGQQIGREEAVAIANEDAAKSYRSLDSFMVVACELARLWVIIYDGGGPEYFIDKESGAVLFVQRLPQGLDANDVSGEPSGGISETEAIEISRRNFADFLASYGNDREQVGQYDAVACGLAKAYRVFFEYRMKPGDSLATMPNTNPPSYVIDKRTGRIIYTTHQVTQ